MGSWENGFQSGGGTKINGIIREYVAAAGESISAGDFVRYLENIQTVIDKQLSVVASSDVAIGAVLLPDGSVFVAHSGGGASFYLYGIVVHFSDDDITYGLDTQLSSVSRSGYVVSPVLLPDGKVFIAHSSGPSTHLYGMLVTINNGVITQGSDTQLSPEFSSGMAISAVLLPDGRIFIARNHGIIETSTSYLYGLIVSISNDIIYFGSSTQLSATTQSGLDIEAVLLSDGSVFVAHRRGLSYLLYGLLLHIGDSISIYSADTQLTSTVNSGYAHSTVPLSDDRLFIAYRGGGATAVNLRGLIVTLVNNTLMPGADAQLSQDARSGDAIGAVPLPDGRVFVTYSVAGTYLYGMTVAVTGNAIATMVYAQLSAVSASGSVFSPALLLTGRVFVAHSANTARLAGLVVKSVMDVAQTTVFTPFMVGVARTGVVNGKVAVYVPGSKIGEEYE